MGLDAVSRNNSSEVNIYDTMNVEVKVIPLSEALLEVKSLRTVIRDKKRELTVVDGIDFKIGTNEVVALVGESG